MRESVSQISFFDAALADAKVFCHLEARMRSFPGFALRVTIAHIVTYWVAGGIWFSLVTHTYYTGPHSLPQLRDPYDPVVMKWILPAQIARGILYAAALYPLRPRLLQLGRWDGVVIASLLLIIGMVGGISGQIEALVFTKTAHFEVFVATLPEVIAQTVAFGYWLMWWEKRRERRTAAIT